MTLCQERRGIYLGMEYVTKERAVLRYDMPLAEILIDFYDKLKSLSRGYASLDYNYIEHRESDVVRLDIALNGDPVDALSMIVHQDSAYNMGRDLASRLKEVIPRQMYDVAIQACIGARGDLPHQRQGAAQERDRQVLRRRYYAQTQASRETKRGQETYEDGRQGRNPAGRVPGGSEGGEDK